ncbi:hypothetical protein DENSPDRAFT_885824 [Dentipellis sp. KUC8613]|nr:hypothetical protein DENSPDRAFT_885824 [Dentipellis sp. KUC8613]
MFFVPTTTLAHLTAALVRPCELRCALRPLFAPLAPSLAFSSPARTRVSHGHALVVPFPRRRHHALSLSIPCRRADVACPSATFVCPSGTVVGHRGPSQVVVAPSHRGHTPALATAPSRCRHALSRCHTTS